MMRVRHISIALCYCYSGSPTSQRIRSVSPATTAT